MDVAAVTFHRRVGVSMLGVRFLKGLVANVDDRANTVEVTDCKMLDNISELWALVEGLSWAVGHERSCTA